LTEPKKKKVAKGKTSKKKADTKEVAKIKSSPEEKKLINVFLDRVKKQPLKFEAADEEQSLRPKGDKALAHAKLSEAFGTADRDLQMFLLNQLTKTFRGVQSSEKFCDNEKLVSFCDNALAILQGIAPQDEIEALLAVQMIGLHNMAMDAMSRAMITDQYNVAVTENVNRATKLTRTFTAQMEALKKYRTGGQQKMTVEHVHVHKGGQAIVGNVNPGGGAKDEK